MGIEIGFFVAAAVLLVAIVYGVVKSSRRPRRNEPITEEATRALYREPETYEAKAQDLRRQAD